MALETQHVGELADVDVAAAVLVELPEGLLMWRKGGCWGGKTMEENETCHGHPGYSWDKNGR